MTTSTLAPHPALARALPVIARLAAWGLNSPAGRPTVECLHRVDDRPES